MKNQDLIKEIKDTYSEWFEISHNPHELLVSILASKLIGLKEYTEYLEKHLQHIQKEAYERSNTKTIKR